MLLDIVLLIVGVALILIGANALTDGASSIAARMGVSELVIGLTVVALGTSMPEIVVSVIAAIQGSAPLAIGNVVGSNVFNILVIIGLTALLRPIVVEKTVLTIEIPIVILAAAVMFVLGNTSVIDGSGVNVITRSNGIFLLVATGLYIRHTVISAKTQPQSSDEETSTSKQMPVWKAIVWIVAGLAGLVFGGQWFVDGACAIAKGFGVSDAVIGLTIVAAGTSVPELATAIVASLKGKPGLVVGNVIGSNILNVFFVLGLSATITPLPFGDIGNIDLLVMLVASLAFLLFGWVIKDRTITRGEGAILLSIYIAYMAYLVISY